MINNLTKSILILLFTAVCASSCKLDAPIYPEGTVDGTPANTNVSITYTIDGKTVNIDSKITFFAVSKPDVISPKGRTQIGGGIDASSLFSLFSDNVAVGMYDAIIMIGTNMVGTGTVTYTQLNFTDGFHGSTKGSFTGELTNTDTPAADKKLITGTFDIKL